MLYHLLFSIMAGVLAGYQGVLLGLHYRALISIGAGVGVWLMALRLPPLLCGAIFGIPYGIAAAFTHASVHGSGWMILDGIAYGFSAFLIAWYAGKGARGDFSRFVGGKPW